MTKALVVVVIVLISATCALAQDKLVVHPEYLGFDRAQPHNPVFRPDTNNDNTREGQIRSNLS